MGNQEGQAAFGVVMVLIVIVLIPFGIVSCAGRQTGQGQKVGTVIKLADEGFFIKTHEMEIVRGGMAAGAGSFSVTPACITITDDAMLAKAQKSFDDQKEITVKYDQYLFTPFTSEGDCGGSDYYKFATGIEERNSESK